MTDRFRLSLFYPATYLVMSGVGMVVAPRMMLDVLSDRTYDLVFVRMAGLFVIGLAAFVIQAIRYRLVALYSTIIAVRLVFCTGYIALYVQTRDPFFLAVLGMVGFGVVLSSVCLALDHRATRTGSRAGR